MVIARNVQLDEKYDCRKEEWYHKAAACPFKCRKEKQSDDEFEYELSRSGQGSGNTDSVKPKTLEHTQEVGDPELIDKETLDRQREVKGDSCIPVKCPAIVMFVPITSCKVMWSKLGRAVGSYLSSGWVPHWPVAANAKWMFSILTSDIMIFSMYPPLPFVVLNSMPLNELYRWICSTSTFEMPPDISLPKAREDPEDDCRWTLLMCTPVVGLP